MPTYQFDKSVKVLPEIESVWAKPRSDQPTYPPVGPPARKTQYLRAIGINQNTTTTCDRGHMHHPHMNSDGKVCEICRALIELWVNPDICKVCAKGVNFANSAASTTAPLHREWFAPGEQEMYKMTFTCRCNCRGSDAPHLNKLW